ncbi:MAG: hypothetical protein LUI10_05505 [Lachnospiraceae bacterium]|nr:hypothetical protein [Lachnospiraceae bacterium]
MEKQDSRKELLFCAKKMYNNEERTKGQTLCQYLYSKSFVPGIKKKKEAETYGKHTEFQ